MNRFEKKIVLVTGGTSGIGLATAKRFVAEGAQVFVTGRRQAELDAAVEQIGENATGIRGDISSLPDLDHLFETIRQQTGRLDILFANAGLGEFAALTDVTEAHFDKAFDVNVRGTLFTLQKALPLMPDGAAVVINGSMVSVLGVPSFGVYAATKAALRSFARTWSVELKDRRIRVNVVSPGTVVTPGYKDGLGLNDDQIAEMTKQAAITAPAARAGTADEIASVVLFLSSEESSYINGAELFADGGAAQI